MTTSLTIKMEMSTQEECFSNVRVHVCFCETKMSLFQRVIEWLGGQALESGCLGILIQPASSK